MSGSCRVIRADYPASIPYTSNFETCRRHCGTQTDPLYTYHAFVSPTSSTNPTLACFCITLDLRSVFLLAGDGQCQPCPSDPGYLCGTNMGVVDGREAKSAMLYLGLKDGETVPPIPSQTVQPPPSSSPPPSPPLPPPGSTQTIGAFSSASSEGASSVQGTVTGNALTTISPEQLGSVTVRPAGINTLGAQAVTSIIGPGGTLIPAPGPNGSGNDTSSSSSSQGLSTPIIAASIVAGLVAVAAIMAIMVVRRKRQRAQDPAKFYTETSPNDGSSVFGLVANGETFQPSGMQPSSVRMMPGNDVKVYPSTSSNDGEPQLFPTLPTPSSSSRVNEKALLQVQPNVVNEKAMLPLKSPPSDNEKALLALQQETLNEKAEIELRASTSQRVPVPRVQSLLGVPPALGVQGRTGSVAGSVGYEESLPMYSEGVGSKEN
ncbi:hypothetical protein BC829DRAFT_435604 [Chytridium lagenaria]|nr:hypothetical protein BC829DRAFT_435604 [Chytridium lagenaria]